MAVILTVTATPSSFAAGTWPLATLQGGPAYRLTVTPTSASTSSVYSGYQALLASNDNGGLYMVDRRVELYNGTGGGTLVGQSALLSWSAGQAITITVRLAAGANASSIQISGATTGNGTFPFTSTGTYFTNSVLGVGQFTNSNTFTWPGTISNIDDTAGITRSAVVSAAATVTSAASRIRRRAALVSATATAASAAVLLGSASAATSASATVSSSARVTHRRGAVASASATASSAASGLASFGYAQSTSALWPFGRSETANVMPGGYLVAGVDADGRTPVQVDTQPSGSAFLIAVARPVATVNKTVTDNKGNTFTSLGTGDYGGSSAWENQILLALDANGGTDHEWSANGILNDEITFGVSEIANCAYRAAYATSFTPNGQTQISPSVNLKGRGVVVVDWFGDGPVNGAEGAVWTITASGEGSTWLVADSRIINHTNGWIQWKRWYRTFNAATNGIQLQLTTVNPAQGARWHATALMEVNLVEGSAAASAAASVTSAALRTLRRAGVASSAGTVTSAALRTLARGAVTSATASAASAAVPVRNRSAATSAAATTSSAATPARNRSAAASGVATVTSAAALTGTYSAAASATATVSSAAIRALKRAAAAVASASVSSAAQPLSGGPGASASATATVSAAAVRTMRRSAAASAAATVTTAFNAADPVVAVEDAIQAWVVAGSGLAANRVIWKDQSGPAINGTYIALKLRDIGRPAEDWTVLTKTGNAVTHAVVGPRTATLEITCFYAPPLGALQGILILDRVIAAKGLPSVQAVLRAGNVGIGRTGRARSIDGVRSELFDPRATVEVTLHLMSEISEPGYDLEAALVALDVD